MLEYSIPFFGRTRFTTTDLLLALSARERAADTFPQPCSQVLVFNHGA
ncbi:hypothetical protein FRUB_01051 [Fimbriiglobus ruber]|uniref:Uncharacterized protein n=1 Tax=Fimbriiglobus ruber TaxID=1908690 RepID=A0A225E186_9BACT|nr:hypothetical protein FRUB_01051 [Fimbriiglobus ruber]